MKITNNTLGQMLEAVQIAKLIKEGKLNIDINKDTLDITVEFRYSKLKGKITIIYVDEEGNEIAERVVMDNLELNKTYIIEPKVIDGYKLIEE